MFEPLYTDIKRNNRHAEKTSPCEKGAIDHSRGAQIGYPLARNGKGVALRDCAAQRLDRIAGDCTMWGDLFNRPVCGIVQSGKEARVNNSRHNSRTRNRKPL
jgi:hypothetical protein